MHRRAFIVGSDHVMRTRRADFRGRGADIYTRALKLVDRLYITEIQQEIAGDAWFPEFGQTGWQEMSREILHQEAPQPRNITLSSIVAMADNSV